MDEKKIVTSIDSIIKPYHFKKNRYSWRKTKNNITVILALQKSRYSNSFTFEVGICIDITRDINKLKYYNCGISFRLNSIPAFHSVNMDNALSLPLNDEKYFLLFIDFLEREGMSVLMNFFSLEYLHQLYKDGFFENKMIDNISKHILSDDSHLVN